MPRSLLLVLLAVACTSQGSNSTDPAAGSFAVRGTLAGLSTAQRVTLNWVEQETLELRSNGAFQFRTPVTEGQSYHVDIVSPDPAVVCQGTGLEGVAGTVDVVLEITCGRRPAPDLAVKEAHMVGGATVLLSGTEITVQARVVNQGNGLAAGPLSLVLSLRVGGGTELPVSTQDADPLAAGEQVDVTLRGTVPSVAQDVTADVWLEVEPGGSTRDRDPSNNATSLGSLDIHAAAWVQAEVTGLPAGDALVLRASSAAGSVLDLPVHANGVVRFPGLVELGRPVAVQVQEQPASARCVRQVRSATPVQDGTVAVFTCTAGTLTRGHLQWSEIGLCTLPAYGHASCWAEVHNTSTEPAELSAYRVRVPVVPWDASRPPAAEATFPLAARTVPPGGYAFLQGALHGAHVDGLRTFLGLPFVSVPWWGRDGFLELTDTDGNVVDFVALGDGAPASPDWTGPAVPQAPGTARALARRPGDADTDGAADWHPAVFPTPGGPNDVECTEDADRDGLPDCAELPGTTCGGLDLYGLGARVGTPDVFWEIDHMDGVVDAPQPPEASLEHIRAVFHQHGVALHVDVGARPGDGPGWDLGGGNAFPFRDVTALAETLDSGALQRVKEAFQDPRREPYFHYAAMVNRADCSMPAAACAEIAGMDLVVTVDRTAQGQELVNRQSLIWMHELGHNLGLRHGGDEDLNFKPNYLSVMNYLYSDGLPDPVHQPGDRFYEHLLDNAACTVPLLHSPKGPPEDFLLDYSGGGSTLLDPQALLETQGLGRPGMDPVDFNCNGITEDQPYASALPQVLETHPLHDFDDWGHLQLVPTPVPGLPPSFPLDHRVQVQP